MYVVLYSIETNFVKKLDAYLVDFLKNTDIAHTFFSNTYVHTWNMGFFQGKGGSLGNFQGVRAVFPSMYKGENAVCVLRAFSWGCCGAFVWLIPCMNMDVVYNTITHYTIQYMYKISILHTAYGIHVL